jgi:hypothetical protein
MGMMGGGFRGGVWGGVLCDAGMGRGLLDSLRGKGWVGWGQRGACGL